MQTTKHSSRVLIAGGYGLVGSHIARHIRKISKDVTIILAGRNPDKGLPLARELGNATTAYFDYEDTPGADLFKEVDLIIAALSDPADLLLQAVALVGSEKIAATPFTSDMLIPWLRAILHVLPELAQQIDEKDYKTQGSNLAMQAIGFDNIIQASKDQGITTDLLTPMHNLINQRVTDGAQDEDLSSLIEIMRQTP